MQVITRADLEEGASLKNAVGIISSAVILVYSVAMLIKEPSNAEASGVWIAITVLCALLTAFLIYRMKRILSGVSFR